MPLKDDPNPAALTVSDPDPENVNMSLFVPHWNRDTCAPKVPNGSEIDDKVEVNEVREVDEKERATASIPPLIEIGARPVIEPLQSLEFRLMSENDVIVI